jgi:hypothetical protein
LTAALIEHLLAVGDSDRLAAFAAIADGRLDR